MCIGLVEVPLLLSWLLLGAIGLQYHPHRVFPNAMHVHLETTY